MLPVIAAFWMTMVRLVEWLWKHSTFVERELRIISIFGGKFGNGGWRKVLVIVCCKPCWPWFHSNWDESSPSHAAADLFSLPNQVNARLENNWFALFNKKQLVERNRTHLYFVQQRATCWTLYFNIQHCITHCSTFTVCQKEESKKWDVISWMVSYCFRTWGCF